LAPKKLGTIQTYEQYIQRILTARNNAFVPKVCQAKVCFQQSWHKKVLIAIAYSHALH